MWTKLSMALLCCCSLSAWAAPAGCGPGKAPAYTFEWVPQDAAQPSLGSVRVRDASGAVVQVLDNVENYYADSESLKYSPDFNNDGCKDLRVTSSVAAIGNESVTVFLYDPARRRFVPNEALSAIGGLYLDARDPNCVYGGWKGGAANFYSDQHCWHKGRLVKRSEYSVEPLYNEEGEFQCYRHVETHYRNGKARKRISCTKKL